MEQTIKCFNEDVIELLKSEQLTPIFSNKKSIAYIDPPYGGASSDYPKLYSFLEEYIHMKPLAEIEKIQKFNRYAKAKGYEEQFIEFLDCLAETKLFDIWVLSYNESSWKPIEEIVSLLQKYKKNVIVKKKKYQYNYRKNETETTTEKDVFGEEYEVETSKGKREGFEYLIICKEE
jgi:adenine-specific DNA methylase